MGKLTITILMCILMQGIAFSQYTIKEFELYKDSAIQETDGLKSLPYSSKLLQISSSLNNDSLIAQSYIELAHDYKKIGNHSTAIKYVILAAEYYEKELNSKKNKGMLGMIYNLIGTIYSDQKNFSQAVSYYEKAIFLNEESHSWFLPVNYTGIGEVYRLKKNFNKSFFYFNKADSLFKLEENNEYWLALSNCNLGLVNLGLANYRKSDSLLQLSFDYYIPNKKFYPVCISYYEIAKKAFENGRIAKANEYAKMAIDMALDNNFTEQAMDVYLLLHELKTHEQKYKVANEYLSKHYQYKDSVANTKVVSQIAEQRAEFEIGQKQTEVDHFKAISKARTTIAYLLSIGLFLIVALALFLVRVNRKRKKANHELNTSNVELNQALHDKEMLMKEIHHRVKNNLQIISSIISLQNGRVNDVKVREVFEEMQRRIMAIASIHQKLYKGNSVSQVNMKEYLEEIVSSIHTAFNNDQLNVVYEVLIQNVELEVDAAVSIGLIVNELTTNSYKYAFNSEKNNHFIVGLNENEKGCELIISDNGAGAPEGEDILKSNSLGLRMVNLLARQKNGTLNYTFDQGAKFTVFFEGMKAE